MSCSCPVIFKLWILFSCLRCYEVLCDSRLIEDDDLYAPPNAHKASDAAQSSFRCPSCDTVNERRDIYASTALRQLGNHKSETVEDALEDIKSFHGYFGPAEDMRSTLSRNNIASSAVVQPGDDTARSEVPSSPSSKSRKKRHSHGRRRTSTRLRQMVTTLSERQKNSNEILKQLMHPAKTEPDEPTTSETVPVVSLALSDEHCRKSYAALSAARKTSEVEAMIQRLQVNLTAGDRGGEGVEGATETTDPHYTSMPCEPVLLTRIASKRTPNYYEYARKTTPPKKSPRKHAQVSKPAMTLALAGRAITEQKLMANVEEKKVIAKVEEQKVTELQLNVSQDTSQIQCLHR